MNLKEIIAISGHPGLFRHISQAKNGIIVESLITKKRMPAYSSMKISTLEDIAVFTTDGEIALKEVLKRIFEKESGGKIPFDAKDPAEKMKEYFASVIPEYDKEKVYFSDIKKLFSWYNILQGLKLLEFTEEPSEEKPAEEESEEQSTS